jgi:RimJ/RimL family protein N-acetyltransferase
MDLEVREMQLAETELIIGYFHNAAAEHLEMLGVDPTRLPPLEAWREHFRHEYALPDERRNGLFVVWRLDGQPVGFSSCDKISRGDRAFMHLHVTVPEMRRQGVGSECVRLSADFYFARLSLITLFCEPNAYNVAPNRTLQKAGFKYLKTHMTVPGPLNFHQPVTRWVIER